MKPGISLNVFVGSPQLLRRFPDGPCLIIEADQQRLDQFRFQHSLERHRFAVVFPLFGLGVAFVFLCFVCIFFVNLSLHNSTNMPSTLTT